MRVGFITGIGARGHILVRVKDRVYDRNGYDFQSAWTLCGKSTDQTMTASVTWEGSITDVDCKRCIKIADEMGITEFETVED